MRLFSMYELDYCLLLKLKLCERKLMILKTTFGLNATNVYVFKVQRSSKLFR